VSSSVSIAPNEAEEHRYEFVVVGMTCAACSNRVERTLGKNEHILDATVNLANGRTVVRHDGSVASAEVASLVQGIGYQVTAY